MSELPNKFSCHVVMIAAVLLEIVLIHAVETTRANAYLEIENLVNFKNWYFNSFWLDQSHSLNQNSKPQNTL